MCLQVIKQQLGNNNRTANAGLFQPQFESNTRYSSIQKIGRGVKPVNALKNPPFSHLEYTVVMFKYEQVTALTKFRVFDELLVNDGKASKMNECEMGYQFGKLNKKEDILHCPCQSSTISNGYCVKKA